MRTMHLVTAVVTVAVASACDRQQEREREAPAATEITSGPMDRILVPTGWDEREERDLRKREARDNARAKAQAPPHTAAAPPVEARDEGKTSSAFPEVRDTIDEADPRSDPEGVRDPWDAPPIVGTTTVTAGELEPASEDAGAQPEQPAQPQEQKNTSTVLGDGSSGMYTGGEGTYGGRATWGTGAGASK